MTLEEFGQFEKEFELTHYLSDVMEKQGWDSPFLEMGTSDDEDHAFYFTSIKNEFIIKIFVECELHNMKIFYGKTKDKKLIQKEFSLAKLNECDKFFRDLLGSVQG